MGLAFTVVSGQSVIKALWRPWCRHLVLRSSHGSNKVDHKNRRGAARDTAACLLTQARMDGGNWLGFLLAKPLTAVSLEPGKRLFNLTAVFPAENGYLRLDVWDTTSHFSQWDIRSLQEITQGSTALGKEPQGSCGKWARSTQISSLTKLIFDHSGQAMFPHLLLKNACQHLMQAVPVH